MPSCIPLQLGQLTRFVENGTSEQEPRRGRRAIAGARELDGNDAAKGAGAGVVLAADHADVLLARDGAGARLVRGDLGYHWVVRGLRVLTDVSYCQVTFQGGPLLPGCANLRPEGSRRL